MEIVEVYHII